jgi:hypothetical protein
MQQKIWNLWKKDIGSNHAGLNIKAGGGGRAFRKKFRVADFKFKA